MYTEEHDIRRDGTMISDPPSSDGIPIISHTSGSGHLVTIRPDPVQKDPLAPAAAFQQTENGVGSDAPDWKSGMACWRWRSTLIKEIVVDSFDFIRHFSRNAQVAVDH